ncbi:MAG TPA: DUF4342 domain-containing protein [Vicinamibacteria bacterium]|nr:DUF4342 domain-containing protein [Vicinamibacteria bacterium]
MCRRGLEEDGVRQTWESFKVTGDDLLRRVKEILHEGNVRRIVIKQGARTVVEFPVTIGVVGALAAPSLAAVGALAALLTECTIEVERDRDAPPPPPTVRVSKKKKS